MVGLAVVIALGVGWAGGAHADAPDGVAAAVEQVAVVDAPEGLVLTVDGAPFFVRGMNWDHIPVGQNYRYSLWAQDDATIIRVLEREMPLLQAMGVNAIRQYDDIPARWIETIYRRWGIRTMVNPLFGRYGLEIDGVWVPTVDYADPKHRAAIRARTLESVERLRGTPGVLMWLLGNENNYGLAWTSFEIEDLPDSERDAARAASLYTLWGEVVDAIHVSDPAHPVAICNGDLQYLDLIQRHVPNLDVLGTNVYRGRSAGDLYARVRDTLGVPVLFTEFGADAFDARRGREDALTQADIVVAQWRDVYANTRGRGVGNAIGGFQFQWADGWWKYRQDERLDVHDTHASWSNGGYPDDLLPGRDNMNEEWFGVTARVPDDGTGQHGLVPRPAYDSLRAVWTLDPYAPDTDDARIARSFATVLPAASLPAYEATMRAAEPKIFVKDAEVSFWTYTTRDTRTGGTARFGHTESAMLDIGLRPVPTLEADVGAHVLGGVAGNLIDNLTWETRGGRLLPSPDADGTTVVEDQLEVTGEERVRLSRAAVRWETPSFTLSAFHRVGHAHWGDAGDVFGLYREAWYGENIDIYAADVPSGVEVVGNGALSGLRFAAGPQLWWGANPAVIGSARVRTGPVWWTVVHLEDVATLGDPTRTRSIPIPRGRASSLAAEVDTGRLEASAAGLVAGTEHIGQAFSSVVNAGPGESYGDSGLHVLDDTVRWFDTLGGRARVAWTGDRVRAYALGTYRGLVADAGPDATTTFTGWTLKDHGVGNVVAGWAGATIDVGRLQIGPNLHVQKPLVGANPALSAAWDGGTGWYDAGTRPRNIVDDPFAVSANRETWAAELLLVWDPTPASWWWAWDRDVAEDAPFGASLDLVYRHQPTARDAAIGFGGDGAIFTFAEGLPAADTWDATVRVLGTTGRTKVIGAVFVGRAQSTGQDDRLVFRKGGEATAWIGRTAIRAGARWDDWGPYDYHRTFNLTFPFQSVLEVSHGLTGLRLPIPGSRIGVRGQYRVLDDNSPDGLTLGKGAQLELATYVEARL